MHSVSLNSYNVGAAAKGVVAGVVAGGNKRHTDYGVTNREWALVNDIPLSEYLYSLNIVMHDHNTGNFRRSAMLSYMGVRKFYCRSVYRHQYVHGGYVCNLDPWNREFPMFPGCNTLGLSGFAEGGYKKLYDYERFHSSLWGDAADVYNVIVLSTSVCGYRVYCVDVLS
jgi:hypothetical protein